MISLIVILLATYAYSVPVLPHSHNATSAMEGEDATAFAQVENATIDFRLENIVILARRDTSDVEGDKRGNVTVGLSSSSSSEDDTDRTVQTTDKTSSRQTEMRRGVDDETNESFDDNVDERSFTEDSLSTEMYTKHGIEAESFQSSTVEDTSVSPSSQLKNAKRAMDGSQWLADDENQSAKRAMDGSQWLADDENQNAKRAMDGSQWLSDEPNDEVQKRSFEDIQSSTVEDETSTGEETSVPSTSEVTYPKHGMKHSSSFPAEAFNQRALGSSGEMRTDKRGMEQLPSLTDNSTEEFNRRAIGHVEAEEFSTVVPMKKIQSESTIEEQPSTSTEVTETEESSTSEHETTVAPVADSTRPSSIPSEGKSKILAIIPGQISRTEVIQPTVKPTVGYRPVEHVRLSQGRNQSIVEEKEPDH